MDLCAHIATNCESSSKKNFFRKNLLRFFCDGKIKLLIDGDVVSIILII